VRVVSCGAELPRSYQKNNDADPTTWIEPEGRAAGTLSSILPSMPGRRGDARIFLDGAGSPVAFV